MCHGMRQSITWQCSSDGLGPVLITNPVLVIVRQPCATLHLVPSEWLCPFRQRPPRSNRSSKASAGCSRWRKPISTHASNSWTPMAPVRKQTAEHRVCAPARRCGIHHLMFGCVGGTFRARQLCREQRRAARAFVRSTVKSESYSCDELCRVLGSHGPVPAESHSRHCCRLSRCTVVGHRLCLL